MVTSRSWRTPERSLVPVGMLRKYVTLLVAGVLCTVGAPGTFAAQAKQPSKRAFFGSDDREYSYPTPEGEIGHKDPSALEEIRQAGLTMKLSPLNDRGLEVSGTMSIGTTASRSNMPATFTIQNHGHFRLDVQEQGGSRSLRIADGEARVVSSTGSPQTLLDIEFGDPLALPVQLEETISRADVSVIDDGPVSVNGHVLNKVTVTIFHARIGAPVSASLYLDPATHLLQTSVFEGHSESDRSTKYLKVVNYGDYRLDQDTLLPHSYIETVNGQVMRRLTVTKIRVTDRQNDSLFQF